MLDFTGEHLSEISFPLGGIGTGSVGLAGNGRLIDWEIFNRPNKCSYNEYTNFAVKAESGDEVLDARILQGDIYKNLMGDKSASTHHSWGYGHGPNRTTLSGMAHFSDVNFSGRFPLAQISYNEEAFPGKIKLSAFNPFIPSDDKNSSIPAAFFQWDIENTSDREITYTVAFSCGNPLKPQTENRFSKDGDISGITLESAKNKKGNLKIATDCPDVSYQEYWYRSGRFDDLTVFWREFSAFGKLQNRHYDAHEKVYGRLDIGDMCTLEGRIKLKPREKGSIRFVLSWYFPVFEKHWGGKKLKRPSWKNYYASLFSGSDEAAEYCLKNFDSLFEKTKLFADSLYSTTIPEKALEAAGANLAVLKSSTCMRLEDGTFYAFEGTNADTGSCEGSCTHVWNYAYALPFLFPALERSMRDADYKYNFVKTGEMKFRIMLPLGSKQWNFRACVDGQFGGIIKLYRDWKISGDDEFLKRNWEKAKKALEYAWSDKNPDKWDPEKSGVITGRQHHTLDVELFGPNPWLTGFYIGGLLAGSEIAEYLGEKETAAKYRRIAEKGKKYIDSELWNGRYYVQKIDVKDKNVLKPYGQSDKNICNEYWNDEKKEIKYQIGEGCQIDQTVAQWHMDICGLGEIFPHDKARAALRSLYDINFKSMREVFNPCRIFALNDEKGLLICNWDKDAYKPQIPIPYSEEVMTGFEYAAAAEMIKKGLIKEGTECIEAVRDRYDGKKRNPYAEIECGSSYARSMASYSFIPLFSGFIFDKPRKTLGFKPIQNAETFKTFWSIDGSWGTFEINGKESRFCVLYGEISLNKFILPEKFSQQTKAFKNGEELSAACENGNVIFPETVTLKEKDCMEFKG